MLKRQQYEISYRNTRVERIYGREELTETLGSRFKAVLGKAYQKTEMRAVVLIDEYDKQLFFSYFLHILAEK
ncbi:AAA family ATPase [Segatella copri]|uniref:AAA family ATPase n=1 Tax=Segatella copri TaxID=165179 RepID=A0AAW9TBG4_9BACT|nr:AAA family ATPase [Segatella copri]MQN30472.1 AAA family ATPase [Segatella copri]MQN38180.1 AAA family ATPase [Segatella copri]MQN76081.1 AAA family ATPase [Segatella copri]MQO25812.1 AAA family ATPase [Segatella copri]